jgi:hypothetical protein
MRWRRAATRRIFSTKLIALVDAQPEDYRSFIDWEGKTA